MNQRPRSSHVKDHPWLWGGGSAFLIMFLIMGMLPGKPGEFVTTEYGTWEANLILKEDYEDCDSDGDCSTSSSTIDQVQSERTLHESGRM